MGIRIGNLYVNVFVHIYMCSDYYMLIYIIFVTLTVAASGCIQLTGRQGTWKNLSDRPQALIQTPYPIIDLVWRITFQRSNFLRTLELSFSLYEERRWKTLVLFTKKPSYLTDGISATSPYLFVHV